LAYDFFHFIIDADCLLIAIKDRYHALCNAAQLYRIYLCSRNKIL